MRHGRGLQARRPAPDPTAPSERAEGRLARAGGGVGPAAGAFLAVALACGVPGRALAAPVPAGDTVRLSLAGAVERAARQSRSVARAGLGVRGAQARAVERRSELLPSLSLSGVSQAHTLNTVTFGLDFPTAPGQEPFFDPGGEVLGPIRTTDVRGRVSQTLLDWAAVERLREAGESTDAARARQDEARERAGAAAATAYVRALGSRARLDAQRADVDLSGELVDVARELLAAGVAVRLDVTRAEAQLAGMRARLIAAESEARRTRLALLRALDLPLGTDVVLTDTLGVAGGELPDAEDAVATALEERGDLRAAESDIRASRRELAAVRAERLPRVDLVVDDGWIGRHPDNLLNTYLWSLEVSVPVFSGFRNRSRREQERVREESLTLQAAELREDVAYQVRDALLELSAATDQVAAARVQLRLAREEYDQARERFQEGVAGTADVITAGLRLNQARLSEVDAVAARELARVSLAAAQGTASGIR